MQRENFFKQSLENLEDDILLHGFIKELLHATKNGWLAGRNSERA